MDSKVEVSQSFDSTMAYLSRSNEYCLAHVDGVAKFTTREMCSLVALAAENT